MTIFRVISAFIVGCFIGVLILLGVACAIGAVAAVVKIYSVIKDLW